MQLQHNLTSDQALSFSTHLHSDSKISACDNYLFKSCYTLNLLFHPNILHASRPTAVTPSNSSSYLTIPLSKLKFTEMLSRVQSQYNSWKFHACWFLIQFSWRILEDAISSDHSIGTKYQLDHQNSIWVTQLILLCRYNWEHDAVIFDSDTLSLRGTENPTDSFTISLYNPSRWFGSEYTRYWLGNDPEDIFLECDFNWFFIYETFLCRTMAHECGVIECCAHPFDRLFVI
jgi:hypothetical protein